jgi:hypothetical protein
VPQRDGFDMEPIIGNEEIKQQMPHEGRMFKAVDNTWRMVMGSVGRLWRCGNVLLERTP